MPERDPKARSEGVCVRHPALDSSDCPRCRELRGDKTSSGASRQESEPTQVMLVLDLLLDIAYHEGTSRDLAVAAEAYTLAGYHDGAIMVSHATTGDTLKAVAAARKGRNRRLLKHDAQGALNAVRALVREGVLDGTQAARRTNQRWLERGGHDRAA